MSSNFYRQTLTCVALWWTVASSSYRRPLFDAMNGSVITIPSWISKDAMLVLQRSRPLLFYGETIGIALATCFFQNDNIRILAAILFSLYHLTESSVTNRHGEYPMLYAMWAMCIQDEEYRQACVLGIAINFILSTGYAKLSVGGYDSQFNYPLWMHPSTLDTYLTCFRLSSKLSNQPLYPSISKRLSESRFYCATLSCATLFLECILIPSTLFVPPQVRYFASYVLIALHVGIAMGMSLQVGMVFITSLPVYMYGFSCPAEFGTRPWLVAATIGLLPTMVNSLTQSMGVPENWPFTPAALFMWNGKTAQCLLNLLMIDDIRMVLATKRVASMKSLQGVQVIHHGTFEENDDVGDEFVAVHDCVLRTIGFTMIQGGEPLIEAVNALPHDPDVLGDAARTLLHRTWAWLSMDQRLVEARTGEDLTHVYFVRIDQDMRITEVLL